MNIGIPDVCVLAHTVSAEYLEDFFIIWERGTLYHGVSKSYIVKFIDVHEMGEFKVLFTFP